MLVPFMSCSAKIPIYTLFASAFFPKHAALVMIILYFSGILIGIIVALMLKSTLFRGKPVPFVMELPNYRIPSLKTVLLLMWDKAKDFIQRAFTVIFISTIIVWFLQNFNLQFNMVTDSQDSILAQLAGLIAPIFAPLGMGDWRIVTSLISGVMAKESVVSTLKILYTGGIGSAMTALTAISILVFSLLYTPCVAAIASVKRELGHKWAIGVVIWQCVVAYLVTTIVHLICMLCGMGG
jgi:ferrous iron transport protein B